MVRAQSLFLVGVALCVGASLEAQSGAVFTTDQSGSSVNGNTYKKPDNVYVSASGLVDGDYYFQVTDSSGAECLTASEAIEDRLVTVDGGVIVSAATRALGNAGKGNKSGGSPHSFQLAPFDSTDGVYKVWMTPVAKYLEGKGVCGFFPTDSKTDNFKVQGGKPVAQTIITGKVFYDGAQTCDVSQAGLSGWRVELLLGGVPVQVDFSSDSAGVSGQYTFIVPLDDSGNTSYVVRVLAPVFDANGDVITTRADGFVGESTGARWLPSDCDSDPVIPNLEFVDGPNFGNVYFVKADTGVGGAFEFHDKGWWHSVQGEDRLNNCGGWEGMLTTMTNPFDSDPGFPPVTLGDDARLRLCLTASSSPVSLSRSSPVGPLPSDWIFVPGAFGEFSEWIVGDALGHSTFKLSREIAAAILNVNCSGLVTETVYINPTGDDNLLNLVSFDEMAYKAICVLLNHPLAYDTGPTPATAEAAAVKAAVDACINEFGGLNTSSTSTVYGPQSDPNGAPSVEDNYGF